MHDENENWEIIAYQHVNDNSTQGPDGTPGHDR